MESTWSCVPCVPGPLTVTKRRHMTMRVHLDFSLVTFCLFFWTVLSVLCLCVGEDRAVFWCARHLFCGFGLENAEGGETLSPDRPVLRRAIPAILRDQKRSRVVGRRGMSRRAGGTGVGAPRRLHVQKEWRRPTTNSVKQITPWR